MRKILHACTAACSLLSLPAAAETYWKVEPSAKYDAMCLIGTLAGDPFYTRFYEPQRAELQQKLKPATIEAATRAYQVFKAKDTLAGPFLALLYSGIDGDTLEAAIAATENPATLRAKLQASSYWDDDNWALYEQARPDLLLWLRGMRDAGFTAWWEQVAAVPSRAKAAEMMPRLQAIDVIPLVEKAVGRKLPSNTITLNAARFCNPHGIRVQGMRFLFDIVAGRNADRVAIPVAIHEMFHPPFDKADPRIVKLIALLEQDPFIHGRWKGHNPSFGYNSFDGFIDEDTTQALDQVIGEKIGATFTDDPDERWATRDEGLHVFAVALYRLLKDQKFLDGNENITVFLDRMVAEGKIAPGKMEALVSERIRMAGPKPK